MQSLTFLALESSEVTCECLQQLYSQFKYLQAPLKASLRTPSEALALESSSLEATDLQSFTPNLPSAKTEDRRRPGTAKVQRVQGALRLELSKIKESSVCDPAARARRLEVRNSARGLKRTGRDGTPINISRNVFMPRII